MKKHILEVDGIRKNFEEKVVLSDIYLKCETGQIIGLLGRNGCGKSTLLQIIFGVVKAPNKCIRINFQSKNISNNISNEINYLHQDHFIPTCLTVFRTICLSIPKQNRAVFCEDVFIEVLLKKKISHLSSGELRYLEIKIILFNSSKFVLLDEPFNGLSPKMIEILNDMIKVNSHKKGIIITDHNYQNVINISTHLLLLKDGKTHVISNKAELVEKGYLTNSAFFQIF